MNSLRPETAARRDVGAISVITMTTPVVGEYRDRTTGLIVFGVVEILMGGICFLFIAVMLFSLVMAGHRATPAPSLRMFIPGMGIYALAGTVFVWLGIGSLLGRRWARALWVCLSGIGLVVGLVAAPAVAYAAVQIPRMMASNDQPALPPAALVIARFVMISVMLLFYIIIPGVFFLFYRSPNVKRTCEMRDPTERWTDRCPLPVLALSLFTAAGALGALMLLPLSGVVPVFGVFVSGVPGYVLILAVAGIMLFLGWALYRLRPGAWWLLLGVMLLMASSSAVTFWQADLGVFYTKMGFASRVVAAATQFGQMTALKWFGSVTFLPWFIWLLYVRRHFRGSSPTADGVAV